MRDAAQSQTGTRRRHPLFTASPSLGRSARSVPSSTARSSTVSTAAGTVATINTGDSLSATVTATDDSGSVSYSKESGDAWISVNSSTGELTGTAPGSAGTYSVTVRAEDPAGNYADRSFDVVVQDNTDPVWSTAAGTVATVDRILELAPDRIALFGYAHVPWKHKGQRAYTEADLPDDSTKRNLYEVGKKALLAHGYFDVGMDHFSLEEDELYKAFLDKTMHRNFMGYTTAQSDLLIGLGNSAISDAKYAYAQNEKVVEKYKEKVMEGDLALTKGHFLSNEDLLVRKFIIDIACKGIVDWSDFAKLIDCTMADQLTDMSKEGIIELVPNGLKVTKSGMTFLRNICMVFDKRLKERRQNNSGPLFSKAV